VRPRVAQREIACRIAHGFEQRLGQPGRQRDAQRVAITGDVFDCDESRFSRHQERDDSTRALQFPHDGGGVGQHAPPFDLGQREVADPDEQIVQAIGGLDPELLVQVLALGLDCFERRGVQQFPQLRVAQELPKLRLVDRECLGAPFRQRRIPVVDVVGDVAEEQRRRERRRHPRIDRRHAKGA
jgi:hypothetical protein